MKQAQYYPQALKEYIGQPSVVAQVEIDLRSSQLLHRAYPHTLIYGFSGCGKTALADAIANELGSTLIAYPASAFKEVSQLVVTLTNLKDEDVFFIDEIHSLKPKIQEVLYQAIDKGTLSLIIEEGKQERKVTIPLAPFTLIGATVYVGRVSTPLLNRFQNVYQLTLYQESEVEKIIAQAYAKLGYQLPTEGKPFQEIARRSRGIPRIANNLLAKSYQYAIAQHGKEFTAQAVIEACKLARIDEIGLGAPDVRLLTIIAELFKNRPVGLTTLSSAMLEDEKTIETI